MSRFNPVFTDATANATRRLVPSARQMAAKSGAPPDACKVFQAAYAAFDGSHADALRAGWEAVHFAGWFRNKEGRWVRRRFEAGETYQMSEATRERIDALVAVYTNAGADKHTAEARAKSDLARMRAAEFQARRETPPDPRDGHVHEAAFDEDGNGGTSEAGNPPHVHAVFGFKVQPHYEFNPDTGDEYISVHPGSLAYAEEEDCEECPDIKKCMDDGGSREECVKRAKMMASSVEMEIFRIGTHNNMEFGEAEIEEMAKNFHLLKGELRPKLKITHRDHQEKLAGLASYGDVVDVYVKPGPDGERRLFARVMNIPDEVKTWIRERRFPERSIEIYPEFKLGVNGDERVYKNVLKAIALLGAEMPAVTGMAPVLLEECIECQGTMCFSTIKGKIPAATSGEVPEALALGVLMLGERIRKTTKEVMSK